MTALPRRQRPARGRPSLLAMMRPGIARRWRNVRAYKR